MGKFALINPRNPKASEGTSSLRAPNGVGQRHPVVIRSSGPFEAKARDTGPSDPEERRTSPA